MLWLPFLFRQLSGEIPRQDMAAARLTLAQHSGDALDQPPSAPARLVGIRNFPFRGTDIAMIASAVVV